MRLRPLPRCTGCGRSHPVGKRCRVCKDVMNTHVREGKYAGVDATPHPCPNPGCGRTVRGGVCPNPNC